MVTILILIDGFLQYNMKKILKSNHLVTILILIDGFLQFNKCIISSIALTGSQSLF